VYKEGKDVPGYARLVPVKEIAAEDYNCNIRRYVDNAPPPEPHDVRAHLHGGVPVSEVEALSHFWKNYPGLRESVFTPRTKDGKYADFSRTIADKRALSDVVKADPGITTAHARFVKTLEAWWQKSIPLVESLAPQKKGQAGNAYELRRDLLATISVALSKQDILTDHQIRGAFARCMDELKADLKSIAASGWGAELIPDDDILKSQFPALLAEVEQKRLRLAELIALFSAADEEDYEDSDDTGVLPGEELRTLKAELKECNAQAKLAKREGRDARESLARANAAEEKLARHRGLEDEARQIKNDLRASEKKQEELVAAARAKITSDEARGVILERVHRLLVQAYEGYLKADQRACLAGIENLYEKYAVTAKEIEAKRDEEAGRLKGFLRGLGYE